MKIYLTNFLCIRRKQLQFRQLAGKFQAKLRIPSGQTLRTFEIHGITIQQEYFFYIKVPLHRWIAVSTKLLQKF